MTNRNQSKRRDSFDALSHEEDVGYGKPPKAHQFQKGQSGNPKVRQVAW